MSPTKFQINSHGNLPAEDLKTKFFSPDMAVRIAWGLTNQLSENQSVRLEATRATQLMRDIKIKAQDSKDKTEEQYVNYVCAAIEATYRDLVTITNGRNLNFAEVKELRDTEVDKLNQNSQFTTNLQSSIPKISGMTIGGVSVSIIFTTYIPSLAGYFLPLLAIGAAIGHVVDGYYFIPRTNEKIQIQKMKLDFDKNLYYMQYVKRSKAALKALYISADRYHKTLFKSFYYSEIDRPEVETIIDEVLCGINSTMCENISKCMIGNIVKPEMYSVCETGLIENCPNKQK